MLFASFVLQSSVGKQGYSTKFHWEILCANVDKLCRTKQYREIFYGSLVIQKIVLGSILRELRMLRIFYMT